MRGIIMTGAHEALEAKVTWEVVMVGEFALAKFRLSRGYLAKGPGRVGLPAMRARTSASGSLTTPSARSAVLKSSFIPTVMETLFSSMTWVGLGPSTHA